LQGRNAIHFVFRGRVPKSRHRHAVFL
jgi:hypothetical protein